MARLVIAVSIGAVIVATLLSAAVSKSDDGTPTGPAHVLSLTTGDCFQRPTGPISTVEVVPCDQPHNAQVSGLLRQPTTPYSDDLVFTGFDDCLTQFEIFVGASPTLGSTLKSDGIVPETASGWDATGGTIVCIVRSWFQPISYDAENSAN